ncbi:MAG: zinc-ribbon domain-containing protein, partial [Chloroflexi bacterium]|nr:zinc-ribbon domain-containing protein [Chloroflexota bacterium]
MECPRCGQPVEPEASFCSHCGMRVEQTTRLLEPE